MFDLKLFLIGLIAVIVVYFVLKLSGWFAGTPCTVKTRLDGKTVVITGGNSGIGKETALELARRGANIIIGCRDTKKAAQAVEDIKRETGKSVSVIPLDLADTGSVEKFCEKVEEEVDRLDILVNNAGLMMPKHLGTKQGFELHMGVNHLGHHLITHRLYPLLARSGSDTSPSKIVNVSSQGYKFCVKGLDIDDPDFGKQNWGLGFSWLAFHQLYGQSKLAQIYHAREITRIARARRDPVLGVSLHPGAVNTEVTRYHSQGFSRAVVSLIDNMLLYCGKTSREGAWTTIYCCVQDAAKLVGGGFYEDCVEKAVNMDDPVKERKLYHVSDQLLNIKTSLAA